MRFHTNKLQRIDIRQALLAAQKAGHVSQLVDFNILAEYGSRSHARAFEIKLEWNGAKQKGDGRRWTNSGTHGNGGHYAATYDEWGWFIAELFDKEPDAIFGHYKGLDGLNGFDASTSYKYVL